MSLASITTPPSVEDFTAAAAAWRHSARECHHSIELRARGVLESATVQLRATGGELAAMGVVFDETVNEAVDQKRDRLTGS